MSTLTKPDSDAADLTVLEEVLALEGDVSKEAQCELTIDGKDKCQNPARYIMKYYCYLCEISNQTVVCEEHRSQESAGPDKSLIHTRCGQKILVLELIPI